VLLKMHDLNVVGSDHSLGYHCLDRRQHPLDAIRRIDPLSARF
jgi:hypothetical protein